MFMDCNSHLSNLRTSPLDVFCKMLMETNVEDIERHFWKEVEECRKRGCERNYEAALFVVLAELYLYTLRWWKLLSIAEEFDRLGVCPCYASFLKMHYYGCVMDNKGMLEDTKKFITDCRGYLRRLYVKGFLNWGYSLNYLPASSELAYPFYVQERAGIGSRIPSPDFLRKRLQHLKGLLKAIEKTERNIYPICRRVFHTIRIFQTISSLVPKSAYYKNMEEYYLVDEVIRNLTSQGLQELLYGEFYEVETFQDVIQIYKLMLQKGEESESDLRAIYMAIFLYMLSSRQFDMLHEIPEEHLRYMKNFQIEWYALYEILRGFEGSITLAEAWEKAYELSSLGSYDKAFIFYNIYSPTPQPFVSFSGHLFIHLPSRDFKRADLPPKNTYLRSRSALIGLAYLMATTPESFSVENESFRFKKGILEKFLRRYSEELYPYIHKKYGRSPRKLKEHLERRINEDVLRVGRVISTSRLSDEISIDLRTYKVKGPYGKTFYISLGNNFEIAARYGLVLKDVSERWAEEIKRHGWEIYRDFVNDYVDRILTFQEFKRMVESGEMLRILNSLEV